MPAPDSVSVRTVPEVRVGAGAGAVSNGIERFSNDRER